MTPPELLLSSLGACAAYYAVEYLRARDIPATGLNVTVTAAKAAKPARLAAFRIGLTLPDVKDTRHRDGVLRAVKNCLVHNTLIHTPSIEIELVDQHRELELAETFPISSNNDLKT